MENKTDERNSTPSHKDVKSFQKPFTWLISFFNTFSRRKDMSKAKKLQEIYEKIPDIKCRDNCGECCGLISMSRYEEKRIRKYLEEYNLSIRFSNDPPNITYVNAYINAMMGVNKCHFLDDHKKCLIYPVRPIVCRLFGVSEHMKCPYVKMEEYITEKESSQLIRYIKRL